MSSFLFCAVFALSGCASSSCPEAPEADVHGLYDLGADGVFPFPSDRFTRADDVSPTGLRLALSQPVTPVLAGALELLGGDVQAQLAQLNDLDGFALRGPLLMPFDGALDPASLPQDPAASTDSEASVFLIALDGGGPVPISVELLDWGEQGQLLVATPMLGLQPASRYALVATDRLRAADGGRVGPSQDFWTACAACEPSAQWLGDPMRAARRRDLQALLQVLPGRDASELVSAGVFTTQEQESSLSGLWQAVQSAPAFELDLDLDDDGQVDLYEAEQLPDAPEGALAQENLHRVLKGAFRFPEFRDEAGHLNFDSQGRPETQAMVWVPFILALPAVEHLPAPVVILQPGLHARKEFALYVAGLLAAEGMATLAIDLVEHGEGPSRDTAFIDLADSGITAANFLQSAADLAGLLRVVDESLRELDVAPAGAADGLADLDCDRVAYVGSSAGAMVGSLLLSRRPPLDAAVLTVGGGGFHHFLNFYFEGILDAVELCAFRCLGQALMDRADPANHARALSASHWPDLPILAQQVVDDAVMPAAATAALMRELEMPLLEPVLLPVGGLEILSAPVQGRGLSQFSPARHGFLLAEDSNPESSAAARSQIVNFLKSCWQAADGQGTIDLP